MLLKQKAAEKGIDLQVRVPKEPVYVMADPLRLKQIFLNLINNALTYTPEGGMSRSQQDRGKTAMNLM